LIQRKKYTNIVSIACIVIGVIRVATVLVHIRTGDSSPFSLLAQSEPAYLWFIAGGAFRGLSRIWGELAQMTPSSTPPTP